MFMLAQLVQMVPDVEIGGGTYSGTRAVNPLVTKRYIYAAYI